MVGSGAAPSETSLNTMAAFVSFARSGDPNNERMPAWRPYDQKTRDTMLIDAQCEAVTVPLGVTRGLQWTELVIAPGRPSSGQLPIRWRNSVLRKSITVRTRRGRCWRDA